MYFDELPLSDSVLDALDVMHYEKCTPIQEKAIPPILEGRDVIAIAQTGTGKTAAYLLPLLDRLVAKENKNAATRCLIMAPTRELAQQIDNVIEGLSYYLPISSLTIYGGGDGTRYETERKGLTSGTDIIIATPGRLISHIKTENVSFDGLEVLILDEADRMLDMGFYDDIMYIISKIPQKRQTLLFSATLPPKIQALSENILLNPEEIKISVSRPAEKIKQFVYYCKDSEKIPITQSILREQPSERVLIFASSKQSVKELAISLKRRQLEVGEMHSDLEQKDRNDIMNKFRSKQVPILVATDIVSRGIDIDDIQVVINYDVPHHVEDYIHRIGRTARANNDGIAITYVNRKDEAYFSLIERFLKKKIEVRKSFSSNPSPEEKDPQKRKDRSRRRSGRRTNSNKQGVQREKR